MEDHQDQIVKVRPVLTVEDHLARMVVDHLALTVVDHLAQMVVDHFGQMVVDQPVQSIPVSL